MSTVNKLHILGIRSFGPNEKDGANIKFSIPLTLILGQNGCGKTTIIEALKYATCGDLPSGTDSGSGFVHDPELANTNIVRGHVKLQFSDVQGRINTVARMVQVTRKLKKLEFKSLDSTFTDTKGSVSGRCADIDAMACNALGVSKSVLTNVIFCHQEDSAWPLEKGKKIKEKFDAIFGITEYNKCLDHIRQLVKDMEHKKALLKQEVESKCQNFEEATDKHKKLETNKLHLAASNDQIANLQLEMEPIDAKIREMLQKQENFVNHVAKVKDKKNRKQRIREDINELENSIQEKFGGSKEDVIAKIETFEEELRNKQTELNERTVQKKNVINEESDLQKEMSVKQMYLGTLQSQNQQNNEKIDQRNYNLKNLAEELKLPIPSNSQLNETNGVELLKSVDSKINEYNQQYAKLMEDQEKIERSLQTKVDNAREKKVKFQTDIKIKTSALEETKAEIRKNEIEIQEVDKSTTTLSNLEHNLENINKELKVITDSLNVEEFKARILKNADAIKRLERTLTSLDEEIKILNKITVEKANLDELKRRKQNLMSEFSRLKEKNINSLKHLMTEIPETNFKMSLETCIKKLTNEIKKTEIRINENERKCSVLNEKKRHLERQLQDKLKKINLDSDKIEEFCGSRDIDSFLSDLAIKIEESQNTKGTISSSEFLFKRYIEKLKSEDPLCPLCRRAFNDSSEVHSLIDDLNRRLEVMPSRLEEVKNQLNNWLRDQSKAQQLKPVDESIKMARTREIPQLKEEIKNVDIEIQLVDQQLEVDRQALISPQADENIAKNLLSDTTLMDQCQCEIRNLEHKITDFELKLPKIASAKTVDEANNERDQLKLEIDTFRMKKEEEHQKLTSYNEKLTKLNEQKNLITAQQLKIASSVQKRKNLMEKQSELEMKEKKLADEIEQAEAQLTAAIQNLNETVKEQHRVRNDHKLLSEGKKKKINDYDRRIDEIKKLQTAITDYERNGGKEQLYSVRSELTNMQLRKDDLSNLRLELEKAIEEINNFIAEEKLKKLDLDYNLKLFIKNEEYQVVIKEIQNLEGSTELIDVDQFQRQHKQLLEQKKKLESQKSFVEGRQTELQKNIVELERELNKNHYRNAENEYREFSVKFTVMCKAMEDLKEYAKGMEFTMVHFHSDRMKMINTIIRELWRSIYRGNDIDHIEIKTDVTKTTGRSNYNYQVVQVKNGVELDMRGRCSAGQKVLACLIIRIALAETFSKNCGILALDEPTTNLDKENIESLSAALAEIVERRSAQRNFQLIVITHDEEFLKRLHCVNKLDNYLEVKRDGRGKSVVMKQEI